MSDAELQRSDPYQRKIAVPLQERIHCMHWKFVFLNLCGNLVPTTH